MKLIDYIRSLLRTCPLLENERINVDFLDAENGSYSVNTSPAAPIVKRFIDGSSIRQYVFTFSSAELYGEEIRQNLENAGFWEDFMEWIESVTLPQPLETGQEPQKIEVLSSGYAFMTDADSARYQIECRLLYKQKGR